MTSRNVGFVRINMDEYQNFLTSLMEVSTMKQMQLFRRWVTDGLTDITYRQTVLYTFPYTWYDNVLYLWRKMSSTFWQIYMFSGPPDYETLVTEMPSFCLCLYVGLAIS
jgi:hypothetical protein